MKLFRTNLTDRLLARLAVSDMPLIRDISGRSISGRIFHNELLVLARNLRWLGVKQGSTVAILLRSPIPFSQVILASTLCGARVVLLDPAMGWEMLAHKTQSAEVTHIFMEGFLYDFLRISRSRIVGEGVIEIVSGVSFFGWRLPRLSHLFRENTEPIEWCKDQETRDWLIVFTGGTTDEPKGVVHSPASISTTIDILKPFVSDTRVFYADMPHFLLFGICLGVEVIVGPYDIPLRKLPDIFARYGVDTYFSPPYKYGEFLRIGKPLPSCLRSIFLGSAPIYTGFLSRLLALCSDGQRVVCLYGMTEMLPIACVDAREKIHRTVDGDLLGIVLPKVKYRIETDGELVVTGPHRHNTYLGMLPDPEIHTGDLVTEEAGALVMIGRKKDMIIRREYNIYPGLYESVISRIPGIDACALVGVYDEVSHDEIVVLVLEVARAYLHTLTEVTIHRMLASGPYAIDAYALPDRIEFRSLPRSGRQQKIDKKILRNELSSILFAIHPNIP